MPGKGRPSIAIALSLLLGCAGHVNEIAPEYVGAPGVERFLLCAPNAVIALPAEIADGAEPLREQVEAYFEYHDRDFETLDLFETKQLWSRAIERAKEAGDIQRTPEMFAAELAKEHEFDAIAMPSLLMHEVHVSSGLAKWDGMKQRIRMVNAPSLRGVSRTSMEWRLTAADNVYGGFPATSVHVLVYSREGEQVFEGLGGLELMNEVDLSQAVSKGLVSYPTRRDLFDDVGLLQDAIAIAFDPYLPSPLED